MPITATTTLAPFYLPVTPASVVRPVAPTVDLRRPQTAPAAPNVISVDGLRQARSDALAELQNARDAEDSNTTRYLALERDQLAAMVFDRNGVYALGERRSAQRQLETNDRVFLDRAAELSGISGDDRVLLNARLDLERSKSAIERAVPKNEMVSTAALEQQLASATKEQGGNPVTISLRYPNGWAASGEGLPMPRAETVGNVSPGATRVALLYRESLF
ncbi:MAG: hypothetical protein Q7T86_05150 [Hyphomicrobiaceae bacterium]|nr:hypothetical protein [Hyphomicrobiaceae bacterium]